MENKNIVIIVVVLVVFFALPVVMKAIRGEAPAPAIAPVANVTTNPYVPAAPAPAPAPGQYPPANQAAAPQQYVPAGPPPLDANSLPGSVWEMSSPYGKVAVQFGAGGQATASHPMAGNIPATWRIQGNQLLATATAMGQTLNISAEIRGNQLYYNGLAAKRLR